MNIASVSTTSGLVALYEVNQYDSQQVIEFMVDKDVTGSYPIFNIALVNDMRVEGTAQVSPDNVCSFIIPRNATCLPGRFLGNVVFYDSSTMTEQISTYPFEIMVHESPAQDQYVQISDDDIESLVTEAQNQFNTLKQQISTKYLEDETEWDNKFSSQLSYYEQQIQSYIQQLQSLVNVYESGALLNRINAYQSTIDGMYLDGSTFLKIDPYALSSQSEDEESTENVGENAGNSGVLVDEDTANTNIQETTDEANPA